jgi:hypothetical protein
MSDQALTDETLKERAIRQALAGNVTGARQTIEKMVDRRYLRDVWWAILCMQKDRGDVEGVKETIVSCPDKSLLVCHEYRDLPLAFARAGNVAGAIEIAKAMGSSGTLPLLMIPVVLMNKGDCVGARGAVSHIDEEACRIMIMNFVDQCQRKGTSPVES